MSISTTPAAAQSISPEALLIMTVTVFLTIGRILTDWILGQSRHPITVCAWLRQ
jgi:hypothetical protein